MVFPIRVFDSGLNLIAEIDNYESCVYTKTWGDCKDFQIVMNWNLAYVSAFVKDNFVIFNNDPTRAGKIEEVTYTQEKDKGRGGQKITVVGYEAKNVFSQRIIVPAAGQAFYAIGTAGSPVVAETVMKTLVKDQCGATAVDANRKFSLLSVVADAARGVATFISARYSNLLGQLKAISTAGTIGFGVTFDLTNKLFVFDVIPGTDRSFGNIGGNPVVIFSPDYDSAQAVTIKNTNIAYANHAFVGGTGSGSARTIQARALNGGTVQTDLARREVFINASQLSNSTDLNNAGDAALAKLKFTQFIDVQGLVVSQYQYGRDYFVGDIVSISAFGLTYSVRVVSAQETVENKKYDLALTFDKASPELPDFLISQINQLQSDQTNAQ